MQRTVYKFSVTHVTFTFIGGVMCLVFVAMEAGLVE